MGNTPKNALARVALLVAVLAVPIIVQSSVADAQPLGATNAAAKASKYPAPTLNPASVTAGGSTTVSGVQCDPSFGPTNIFVSLVASSGNVLSSTSVPPNPDGTWQVTLTVPPGSTSGNYDVYSTCDMYYTEFYYPPVSLKVTAASASPWAVQGTVNQNGPTGTVTGISCTNATTCTAVGTYVNSAGQTVPMGERWNGTKWSGSALPVLTGEKAFGLNAVSCSSSSSCTAVGNYVTASGRQLTFAEVWSGANWAIKPPVNPTGGSSDVLDAVSCASSIDCTSVGSYNTYVNGQLQSVGYAEVWNGTSWSLQSLPAPAGQGAFALTSVSCPTTSSCIATGWYSASPYSYYGSAPLAMQWSGSGWTLLTMPSPVDAYPYGESVSSVSCTAPTACTAVGSYFSSMNGPTPLVERWGGVSWTIQAAARPLTGYYPTLTGVSCSGASACEAVGWYDSTTGEAALGESWDGIAWSVQSVPSPRTATAASLTAVSCVSTSTCSATGEFGTTGSSTSGLQQNWAANLAAGAWTDKAIPALTGTGFDQLQAVSCSAISACTAVGGTENTKGQVVALTEAWNGVGWTVQTNPSPTGSTSSSLDGIACTSGTACTAVGSSRSATYVRSALIETSNGASWSIVPAPLPAGTSNSSLNAVSCSAANACTAIGSFTSTVTGMTAFLAERWNGSTWTASALTMPADFSFGQLTSVSCSGSNSCVAVGAYYNQVYAEQSLVETWNGVTWTSQVLTNVPEVGVTLNSVSCATPSSCVAVGSDYGSSYGTAAPLAEVLNGTTWTAQTAVGGGRGAVLSGISCTSTTICTATGSASVYGYPNQVPLAETWNGTTWTEQPMPKIPNAAAGYLNAVSCVSVGACATVGTRNLGSTTTLAEGEGGA